MQAYVLIILLMAYNQPSMIHVQFPSESVCLNAAKNVHAKMDHAPHVNDVQTWCFSALDGTIN